MIQISNLSHRPRRDSSIYTFRAHSAEDNVALDNQMRKNKLSQELTGFKQKYSKLHHQIQHDSSNSSMFFSLNKWHKEKIDSIKDDPQIISAKLKFLENRAQIGRADMELNQREHSRKKSSHYDDNNLSATRQTLKKTGLRIRRKTFLKSTYLQQYQKIKQQKKKIDDSKHQQSQQEPEQTEQPHQVIQIYDGLTHYQQLKKRPKFLSFLKNRIRSKNLSPIKSNPQQQPNSLTERMRLDYLQIQKLSSTRQTSNVVSPQKIIEKQYPKFFSRRNDISLPQNVKSNQLCQKLIKQQQCIVNKAENISRQGRRKLQQRLAQIVLQMSSSSRHDPKRIKINKQKLLQLK